MKVLQEYREQNISGKKKTLVESVGLADGANGRSKKKRSQDGKRDKEKNGEETMS